MLDSAKSIQSKMNFVHTALVQKKLKQNTPSGYILLASPERVKVKGKKATYVGLSEQ